MRQMMLNQTTEGWEYTSSDKSVATIGNFDGFHLGHQALLNKTLQIAQTQNLMARCITFEPLPSRYFNKQNIAYKLMRFKDKYLFLKQYGFDNLTILRFNQKLASTAPESFIQDVLIKTLNIQALVVGEDFRFGAQKKGDVKTLLAHQNLSFKVFVVPGIQQEGIKLSSTEIRNFLNSGNIEKANNWLGRGFSLFGRVIAGSGMGKKLGYPTANLSLPAQFVAPYGVFLTTILGDFGKKYALTYVGQRPTFGGKKRVIESHLLDYSGNLYGKQVKCTFLKNIRSEMKFNSSVELVEQIRKDLVKARQILKLKVA